MTEAATFAQDKLEELRATPWNNLASFSGADYREGSTKVVDYYSRGWSVDPNPPSVSDPLRTITVTVTWTDKTRHSIRLLSVLSQ